MSDQSDTSYSGLVVANYGQVLVVEQADGTMLRCRPRKRLGLTVCGDRVSWRDAGTDDPVIAAIEPRRTVLARPGRSGQPKPVAANFDRLLVVSAPRPGINPVLLDRYLVLAAHLQIQPLLVFHKQDLDDYRQADVRELIERYSRLGYEICRTDSVSSTGLLPLATSLQARTGILVGTSGVGKSSIIAGLLPDLDIQVGALSQASGLGRHTTTVTRLYHLPGGGALIDSPGIRDFPLTHLDLDDVHAGFSEISDVAELCRFNDCRHGSEPGCAVRDALGKDIAPERWESYCTIRDGIKEIGDRNKNRRKL